MKKIAVITIFALSAVFPFAGATLCAQGASVEELSKKVAELEASIQSYDKDMLEMLEKNMGIINKLRTENRQLRTRVAELEAELAKPTESAARRSVYASTTDRMNASRDANRDLSIKANEEFDKLKKDEDKVYPTPKKESPKTTEGTSSTQAGRKADTEKQNAGEKKSDSIWNNIFPF